MRIGVIGANETVGRLIVHECMRRGHSVTAIVRDHNTIMGPGCPILECDPLQLTASEMKPFDAIVTVLESDSSNRHAICSHLHNLLLELPACRLLYVGDGRKHPEAKLNEAVASERSSLLHDGVAALIPAQIFDEKGGRSRQCLTGTDEPRNSRGESYISYEDYAVVAVDELERAQYDNRCFTAVSERRERPVQPYLGIRESRPVFEGLSQYRAPLCDELSGQRLRLVFDSGMRCCVEFLTGQLLRWTEYGGEGTVERYECAKGAPDAYFVNLEFSDRKPRTNYTLTLDRSQRLVTLIRTIGDFDANYPYLVDSENSFGYIDVPGQPPPTRRHHYTTDLVGKRIWWHYGPALSIIHVYYRADYHRISFPRGLLGDRDEAEWLDDLRREPYDEPADCIKIRDGLYMFSCMEKNKAMAGRLGNSMIFLIDTQRVVDVGRSFGRSGVLDGEDYLRENYLFSAFGEFVSEDDDVATWPNRYTRDWKKE